MKPQDWLLIAGAALAVVAVAWIIWAPIQARREAASHKQPPCWYTKECGPVGADHYRRTVK